MKKGDSLLDNENQDDENYDNFDSLQELQNLAMNKEEGQLERQSIWKMKTQRKNELEGKSKKDQLINNDLVSKMHEISVTNVADVR